MVGGGDIGLEKVEGLLACDADVTLIAPVAHPELESLAAEGSIEWEKRAYAGAVDLEGVFMVIACTDDTDVNIAVFDDAERRAMLVNIVDVPPLCNFILPAIVRTGPLAIAISTAGASPALAKRMKREVAELFGEEYARLAVILNDARGWAKGTLPTYQDRKEFFEGIVNGEPDPVGLLRDGDEPAVLAIDRVRQGAGRGSLGLGPVPVGVPLNFFDGRSRLAAVDCGEKVQDASPLPGQARSQAVPQAEERTLSRVSRSSFACLTLRLAEKAISSSPTITGRISASSSLPAGSSVA